MKQLLGKLLGTLFGPDEKAFWIEVKTREPACIYYFGPFDGRAEAELAKQGYIEDLEQEGAKLVQATVTHRERPAELTVLEEEGDSFPPDPKPAYSGQP